jgi:hypothetical protein
MKRLSLRSDLVHYLVAQRTCTNNEPLQKVWAIYVRVDTMEY